MAPIKKFDEDTWAATNGIDREIVRTDQMKEIIDNPGAYIKKRSDKLTDYRKLAKDQYKTRYAKFIDEKFGEDLANQKATEWANKYLELLISELDLELPPNLQQFDINYAVGSNPKYNSAGGIGAVLKGNKK